jgi:cellulose synthase/poly-beta-1,6-N-acetylglucosamine synthase-like glycosyltransferase
MIIRDAHDTTDRQLNETPSPSAIMYGAVVIGRNEGARLRRCINSVSDATALVYVDSGSIDGSVKMACDLGVEVVDLDMSIPFTAARARNAGFAHLQKKFPDLNYVQFVDGDCELAKNWTQSAALFLGNRPDVAAVCGRLRERYPDKSVYNWLCDREWSGPCGEIRSCAGNVMFRIQAFLTAGGYRDDIIAAEEDELSVRLRAANWRIWRLDAEMAWHDAAMMHFSQWWRRSVRCGYAFAQGRSVHGATAERHFVWESRRAWLWGIGLPLLCVVSGMILGPIGCLLLLIFPLQIIRQVARNSGSMRDRLILALFQTLARFPEALGQIRFLRDRIFKRQARLIEHKS